VLNCADDVLTAGRATLLEAAPGLMHGAAAKGAVRRFLVSITPDNGSSIALAQKMGSRRTGEQIDTEDGPEYRYEPIVGASGA